MALGASSVDLTWAMWRMWSASHGEIFHSALAQYPEGLDVVAMCPGWLEVLLGGVLATWLGPVRAYTAVGALYLAAAGLGGFALSRELGASRWASLAGGLVLQWDGFLLYHLAGGRLEHATQGLMALALALALASWRRPGWGRAVLTGLAGACVVWASWQQALTLALAVAFLAPWLLSSGRPAGGLRRGSVAALAAALAAAPIVAVLLSSEAAVSGLHNPDFARASALDASLGALGWLAPGVPRVAWVALPGLMLLPWAAPSRDRRLWLGVGVGLVVVGSLALGPRPSLLNPAALPVDPWADPSAVQPPPGVAWAPYSLLMQLPVLERLAYPGRLLSLLGLAAAPATALALDLVARTRGPRLAALAGVVLVAGLLGEAVLADRAPRGRYALWVPPPTWKLADVPGPGAVLDLPRHARPPRHMDYHLAQLVHERPMLLTMQLTHLGGRPALLDTDPVLRWFDALTRQPLPPKRTFTLADFAGLRAVGYRFVVLHQLDIPEPAWVLAEQSLQGLGQPWLRMGRGWRCWDLEPPERERPGRRALPRE